MVWRRLLSARQRKQVIPHAKAATLALLLLTVLYWFLVLFTTAWLWAFTSSPTLPIKNVTQQLPFPPLIIEPPMEEVAVIEVAPDGGQQEEQPAAPIIEVPPIIVLEPLPPSPVLETARELREAEEQRKTLHAQMENAMVDLQRKMEGLERTLSSSSSSSSHHYGDEAEADVDMFALKEVLSLTTLSQLSDEDLKRVFEGAIRNAQDLMEARKVPTQQLRELQGLMVEMSHKREKPAQQAPTETITTTCPPPPPQLDHNYARESDLLHHFQALDAALQKRIQSGNPLSSQATARIREAMQQLVAEHRERSPDPAGGKTTTCASPQDVETMMVEALNALHRKADVRLVLIELVKQIDPERYEDQHIILDADLDAGLAADEVGLDQHPRTLRRVIDTPLVHKASQMVDWLVERVGGYNDSLDQVLDELAPGEDDTVGQEAAAWLLERMDKVPIPPKVEEWKEKAGVLR